MSVPFPISREEGREPLSSLDPNAKDASVTTPAGQIDVLVVDDDPNQLGEIVEYLTRKKLNVISADNGLTALDLVREHEPRLVVMDINMPQMQGDRISQILTSLDHKVAVILMSGFPDVYDRVSATADGVIAVLQKPISLKALYQTVEAVIAA